MKKLLFYSAVISILLFACSKTKTPADIIEKVLNKTPIAFAEDTIRKSEVKNFVVIYNDSDSSKLVSLINEEKIIKTAKPKFTASTTISGLKIIKDDNDLSNIIIFFKSNNKDTTTENYWNVNTDEIYSKYHLITDNKISFSENIQKGTQIAVLFNYEYILDSLSVPTDEMILSDVQREYPSKSSALEGYWLYTISDFKIVGINKTGNTAEVLVNFTRNGIYKNSYSSKTKTKKCEPTLTYKKFSDKWVYQDIKKE